MRQNAAAAEPEAGLARAALAIVSQMEKLAGADAVVSSATLAEASPGKPASDAEARKFAKSLEKSVMSGNVAGIRAAVNAPAVTRRVMAGLNLSEAERIGIETVVATAVNAQTVNFLGLAHPHFEQGGHFRLLHLGQKNGEQRALFRFVQPDGGVTYDDCILVRQADGKVRIDDVYLFAAGEMLSEGLRRELAAALAKGAIVMWPKGRVAAADDDYVESADKLSDMKRRIEEGKFQAALDIYQGLPDRFKTEKNVLLARLQAARALKGKQYDEAVRAYRKEFPHELNLDLIMIDAYFEHKLFERVLACIDGLDRSVGGDPYLDALRAKTHLAQHDLDAAQECAGESG